MIFKFIILKYFKNGFLRCTVILSVLIVNIYIYDYQFNIIFYYFD